MKETERKKKFSTTLLLFSKGVEKKKKIKEGRKELEENGKENWSEMKKKKLRRNREKDCIETE